MNVVVAERLRRLTRNQFPSGAEVRILSTTEVILPFLFLVGFFLG